MMMFGNLTSAFKDMVMSTIVTYGFSTLRQTLGLYQSDPVNEPWINAGIGIGLYFAFQNVRHQWPCTPREHPQGGNRSSSRSVLPV